MAEDMIQENADNLYEGAWNNLYFGLREEFYENQDMAFQYFVYDYESETYKGKSAFQLICEYIAEHYPDKFPESIWPCGDDDNSGYYFVRVDVEESDEWFQFYMHKKDAQWHLEFLGLHKGEE